MERAGDKIFLMLCTIVDSKGNAMEEGQKLDELSDRLKSAIVNSVRRTDTITRYGKGQYLILLINTTEENCRVIENHINSNYLQKRQRTGVSYSVSGIIIQKRELPILNR
jgi:PleD family two-component response regulator